MINSNKVLKWVLIINILLIYPIAKTLGYLSVPAGTTWLWRGHRRYTRTKIMGTIWSNSQTTTLDVKGMDTLKRRTRIIIVIFEILLSSSWPIDLEVEPLETFVIRDGAPLGRLLWDGTNLGTLTSSCSESELCSDSEIWLTGLGVAFRCLSSF